MTYGMKVKLERTRQMMTQKSFAVLCGISRQTLHMLEMHDVATQETKRKIKDATGVAENEKEI